jgi:hypothetical protein
MVISLSNTSKLQFSAFFWDCVLDMNEKQKFQIKMASLSLPPRVIKTSTFQLKENKKNNKSILIPGNASFRF